jgi:restriction endonuclease S subunit
MQYSVVNYGKINLGDRIDAEYFEPSYLKNENRLKNVGAKPLSYYTKVTSSAFYPSATGYYEIGEMPFIRCVDCIDYPAITKLQNDSFEKLPHDFINANKTIKKISNEDIVITKVGSPCFASIIYNIDEVALSRTVLGAYKIQNIDPFYLLVFLRSKYGFEQLIRERELTIQYQLTLERVGRILIFEPSNDFQTKIRRVFIKSQDLYINSVQKYSQAEQLLLSELDLIDWKPKHELSFIKNFSDTQEAERFDAEYFQPKYEEIIEAVKKYKGGFDELGNLAKIKKSVEPGSEAYQEEGTPFVRVSNLSKLEIGTNNQQFLSDKLYEALKKHQPKKGEILLSKDATPGIAYLLNEEPQKMIVSGGILRLKDISREVLPEYLTLVLNSVIGQKQIEQYAGGSIINHWRPDQVKATVIPILKEDKQKEIKGLIEKSFVDRKFSKSLLEIAKRGVEMAIEKDEQEAEKWIEGEIKKLEVKFLKITI